MCTEGAAPVSYREQQLEKRVENYQRNHLGAETERFIEMARELGRKEHLETLVGELSNQLGESRYEAKRMAEQAAYSDNETDKANKRAQGWQERALTAERRHYNLIEKNRKAKKATKKPVAKTAKKK